MRMTTTENGLTIDQERQARIKYLNRQLEASNIPTSVYTMPDAMGHTVNIPTVVLAALVNIAGLADAVEGAAMQGAVQDLERALQIFNPLDLVTGAQSGGVASAPPAPKKKKVLSPEHKAKLLAARARARAAKVTARTVTVGGRVVGGFGDVG